MGHGFEPVPRRDSLLQFFGEAFFQLHDISAAGADQVMMMAIIPFLEKLELGGACAKVESFDHFHLFQEVHRAVNRSQIAVVEFLSNLLDAQRSRVASEDFQDCLPLASDFAQCSTKPLRKFG